MADTEKIQPTQQALGEAGLRSELPPPAAWILSGKTGDKKDKRSLEELEYLRRRAITLRLVLLEANPTLENPEAKELLPEHLKLRSLPGMDSTRTTRDALLRLRHLDSEIAFFDKEIEQGKLVASRESAGPANPKARKHGPPTDYTTAVKVAGIVKRVQGQHPWRECVEEICEVLDDEQVKRPRPWKKKGYRTWCDCLDAQLHLVNEAIRHHLKLADSAPETIL